MDDKKCDTKCFSVSNDTKFDMLFCFKWYKVHTELIRSPYRNHTELKRSIQILKVDTKHFVSFRYSLWRWNGKNDMERDGSNSSL